MTTLIDLVDRVREDGDLFGTEGACPTLVEAGGNPRVLLVTGGNAGGKSLVCRYLDLAAQDAEVALGFMRNRWKRASPTCLLRHPSRRAAVG